MKLQKKNVKYIGVILLIIGVGLILAFGHKNRNGLLKGADLKDNFVELMYFDGEKTEWGVAVHEKKDKLYDEISCTKLRQIPLEKVEEFKTPCFGVRFTTKEGKIDITICDGMLLKGVAKKEETEGKSGIKYDYELYEADFDFMDAYDKYARESVAVCDDSYEPKYGFEDVVEDEEEEDEEDLNVFFGGACVANAELLCKYNNDFYQEEKNENDGVSTMDAKVDRGIYVLAKIKNEGKCDIDIEERRIQKRIGDKWYDLPTESLYESTFATRYLLISQESSLDIPLEPYGELESGKYRAVIDYYLNSENSYNEDDTFRQVACEFEIK